MYKNALVWPIVRRQRIPLLGVLVMLATDATSSAHPGIPSGSVLPMVSAMSVPRASPSKSACVNPGRFANRLYRRQGKPPGYWRAADIGKHALDQLPKDAVPTADGLYAYNGEFYAKLETEGDPRVVRLIPEGSHYRIRLQDGAPGPYANRKDTDIWSVSSIQEDYVQGSVLAGVVPESITTHTVSLQHAAQIMEVMGIPERTLAQDVATRDGATASAPIVYFALAQALVKNLPARLRDPDATEWSAGEIRLIAPTMATLTGRPLVIEHSGTKHAFLANGREVLHIVPSDAVHGRSVHGRYLVAAGQTTATLADHASIFAAVEAATRPSTHRALLPGEWEASFRNRLADALEARSTLPELEHLLHQWIDTQPLPETERLRLKSLAHLRHALVDRHRALAETEERRLLDTTRALMPGNERVAIVVRDRRSKKLLASVGDGPLAKDRIVMEADLDEQHRRIAYYRVDENGESIRSRPTGEPYSEIIDATLNSGNGQVARALGIGPWDWQIFADKLLKRMVDDETMLLQPSHLYLTFRNKKMLAMARTHTADRWSDGDRHYARLRSLDGRTQVVEISAPSPGQDPEILAQANRGIRNTGHRITWRDNKWYLPEQLRAPGEQVQASPRDHAAAAIAEYLPADLTLTNDAVERVLDAIPQLLIPLVATELRSIDVTAGSHLMLHLGALEKSWSYRLDVDLSQSPVPAAQPAVPSLPAVSAAPVTQHAHLPSSAASHFGESAAGTSGKAIQEQQLLASGLPVSQFVKRGIRNEHVLALVNARRLRGMLSEDRHMALVASAAGHAVTVIAPVDAQALQAGGWSGIAALPPGSRIIDSWFGIVTDAASYGERLLAMAQRWEEQGRKVTVADAHGTQPPASPSEEARKMLAAPLRINLWNPRHDPISEEAYLRYIRSRHEGHAGHGRTGLTWLLTLEAWQDYRNYFTRPSSEGAPAVDRAWDIASQEIGAPLATLLANVRELEREHAVPTTFGSIQSGGTPRDPSQAPPTPQPHIDTSMSPFDIDLDLGDLSPPFEFDADLFGPSP